MKIYVGFSHNRNGAIGSKLIRWYLDSQFSHVYLRTQLPLLSETTVLHATGDGLYPMSYSNFLKKNIPVVEYTIEISDEKFYQIINLAHMSFGQKYGFAQNLGIVIQKILTRLGIREDDNILDDGVNCSEWIYEVLEEVYGQWTEKDKDLVTPKDIYEYLYHKNRR
jgi:hypothetical protein